MNNTPDKIKPDFSNLFADYPENEIAQLIDQCTGILGLIFEIDSENLKLPENKLNALYAVYSNLQIMAKICDATSKARPPKTREQLERETQALQALKATPNNECAAVVARIHEIAAMIERNGLMPERD
jgi:hypothetical protein